MQFFFEFTLSLISLFQIYLFFNAQFLFEFIYFIYNLKINANKNKNKKTQVIDIKSHYLQWGKTKSTSSYQ